MNQPSHSWIPSIYGNNFPFPNSAIFEKFHPLFFMQGEGVGFGLCKLVNEWRAIALARTLKRQYISI